MKYCGIDLHSNNSVVSVIYEADHVVAERRLPNDVEKIIGFCRQFQSDHWSISRRRPHLWTSGMPRVPTAGFGPVDFHE